MREIVFGLIVLLAAGRCLAAEWNVLEAGAVGDGVTDCTAAFQKALDEAAKAGGGIVTVPTGRYRIEGNLVIPAAVTLQGTYRSVPLAPGRDPSVLNGSALLAYTGRGSQEGKPFITLGGYAATVAGLIINYPEWQQSQVPPVPYPPCIAAKEWTDNVAVIDCCILNAYEAIKLTRAGRFLVRNVQGYPIWRGIYVDECYDIGRIENIHYWPFGVVYKADDPYCKWINLNGVAFEFARTDWQYCTNTFCFGYGVGYKFSEAKNGGCNGNFLGIGADSCQRAVLVEQAQGPGLLITNGEFVGRWSSTDSVCLEITEKVNGKVSLSNCSFWGPIDRCVWMKSASGQFTASACHFLNWDCRGVGSPAIQLDAGRAILQGNTFGDGQVHVSVGEKVTSAIVMGNQASGGLEVENRAASRAQMLGNEEALVKFTDQARAGYRLTIGAEGDERRLRHWHGREEAGEWPDGGTKRWSAPGACFLLPVQKRKSYELTLDVFVPEFALEPGAGLYLGDKCIVAFDKAQLNLLKGSVPASDADAIALEIRCKGWVPRDVIAGSQDQRVLGVAVRSIVIKAKGAGRRLFDANTGNWINTN